MVDANVTDRSGAYRKFEMSEVAAVSAYVPFGPASELTIRSSLLFLGASAKRHY